MTDATAQAATTDAPAPRGARVTRLAIEVWLWRHGWSWAVALVLAAATMLFWLLVLWPQAAANDGLRGSLRASAPGKAAAVPAAASSSAASAPGQAVQRMLAAAPTAEVQMARAAELARRHGIALAQGRYAQTVQRPAGIERTDVVLNFSAGYPQMRSFVERLLRELPVASVERIDIEREAVEGERARVTLHVALWRLPGANARAYEERSR